jgi:uncharacterized membrane protein YvlD (DUF360 family)
MHHALARSTISVIQHVVVWAIAALLLVVAAEWFQTIHVQTYDDAFIGTVALAAINAFVMPPLIRLAVILRPVLFPLVSFALNAGAVLALDAALPGWDIRGWGPALLLAMALAGLSTLLGSLLAISDDGAWRRYALEPLRARVLREGQHATAEPGIAFLEIDGLSAPVLEEAIRKGYAPTLARWLAEGSHVLTEWEPDLSSQTSASQAGILLGSNANIPAFRWYDRELRRVIVSNTARDSEWIEARHSTGDGLLAGSGASRGNLVSGDAPDSFLTFSTVRATRTSPSRHYALFYTNPYNVARTLALFVADVVREIVAALWQIVRNDRPRVARFGLYPLLRAATTSVLRELTTFAVAGDLTRGVSPIYAMWVAYDEVAHHSGIDRHDALRVLRDLDRDIHRLELAAAAAPRPYRFVVLSDHGQSQGATFRQRWGASLRDVVEGALARENGDRRDPVTGGFETDEGWHTVSALLTDLLSEGRPESLVSRSLRRRLRDGEVQVGPQPGWSRRLGRRLPPPPPPTYADGQVLVLASGSLGLIYLTGWSRRLTLEEIEGLHPHLVSTLLEHQGIGWLLVRSAERGSVVLGPKGLVVVATGQVVGEDPLAAYGPNALAHIRRTDGFADVPDLLIHSAYNPDTGETPAFEELIGSHGGLGGWQARPFVLHPGALALGAAPVVGAEDLYRRLKRWVGGTPAGDGNTDGRGRAVAVGADRGQRGDDERRQRHGAGRPAG